MENTQIIEIELMNEDKDGFKESETFYFTNNDEIKEEDINEMLEEMSNHSFIPQLYKMPNPNHISNPYFEGKKYDSPQTEIKSYGINDGLEMDTSGDISEVLEMYESKEKRQELDEAFIREAVSHYEMYAEELKAQIPQPINKFKTIRTEYITGSRTINTLLVTEIANPENQTVLYEYNYDGTSFDIIENSLELEKYLNSNPEAKVMTSHDTEEESERWIEYKLDVKKFRD